MLDEIRKTTELYLAHDHWNHTSLKTICSLRVFVALHLHCIMGTTTQGLNRFLTTETTRTFSTDAVVPFPSS